MTPSTDAARTSKAAAVAIAALAVVLVGAALPVEHGWGLPVLALACAAAASVWRDGGGAYRSASVRGASAWSASVLIWLAAAGLVAAATSIAVSVTLAFPGAVWALPVVLLGTAAAARVGPRSRLPVAMGMALLVPAVGVLGARHEARGPNASGWAHSGPIHGIHPFQMTAVRIDGYGPFDIPFNDYVEPAGDRGYGPQTYADALQRALHDIAETHFAHGPARAHRAFAQAEVESSTLPAVEEVLGVSPGASTQPRVLVRSGGWGQHSRVEFMCPGKVDHPDGPEPDDLLRRMCPNKYAAEATAGLGVTGRWAGYTEAPGMPRLTLATATGRTRTTDALGASVRTWERRWLSLSWMALGLLALLGLPSRSWLTTGAPRFTAAVAIGGLSAAVVLAFESAPAVGGVAFFESGADADTPWLAWLPVLLLFAGMPELRGRAAGAGTAWGALALLAATVAAVRSLARLEWISPVLRPTPEGTQPLERWIIGAGDLLARARGMDVLETEHGIAAMIVAVLAGGALAILARAATSVAEHAPPLQRLAPALRVPLAGLAILAVAAALVWSRKTFGGATLVPGAIGLTVVLHSGLAWVRQRGLVRACLLVVAVALAAGLFLHSVSTGSNPDSAWVQGFAWVGVLGALAGLGFFASGRESDA